MASSSNSPCAACKFLRRKCMNECVFAPYFPPDQPQKFANVHKVFGASNVTKLLNDIIPAQREDAVNSLAYEAEARLRDPVYGCVGLISILQNKLRQVQLDLYNAKKELAAYIGPSAMMPIAHPAAAIMPQPHQSSAGVTNAAGSMVVPYGVSAMGHGIHSGPQAHAAAAAHALMREQHQQQQQHMMETHQLAAAVREQELMRSYEHQQELARYNSGFDASSAVGPAAGFNQMTGRSGSPLPLALVSFENSFTAQQEQEHLQHPYQHQQPPQPQQQQQQQQERAGSEDGLSSVGPSS